MPDMVNIPKTIRKDVDGLAVIYQLKSIFPIENYEKSTAPVATQDDAREKSQDHDSTGGPVKSTDDLVRGAYMIMKQCCAKRLNNGKPCKECCIYSPDTGHCLLNLIQPIAPKYWPDLPPKEAPDA